MSVQDSTEIPLLRRFRGPKTNLICVQDSDQSKEGEPFQDQSVKFLAMPPDPGTPARKTFNCSHSRRNTRNGEGVISNARPKQNNSKRLSLMHCYLMPQKQSNLSRLDAICHTVGKTIDLNIPPNITTFLTPRSSSGDFQGM